MTCVLVYLLIYRYILSILFEDIGECFLHNGGCEHKCVNTPGSFHCECNQGYRLNADGKSCSREFQHDTTAFRQRNWNTIWNALLSVMIGIRCRTLRQFRYILSDQCSAIKRYIVVVIVPPHCGYGYFT